MSDEEKLPPKASQQKVEAAVEEVTETDDDAGIVERVHAADVAASVTAGEYRETPLIKGLGFLSEISDQPPAFTLAGLAAVGGVLAGRPRLAEAGFRCLASLGVATASKAVLKAFIVRTRPFVLMERGHYETGLNGPNDGPWNSFPSGHTANAVAAACALSRVSPENAPLLSAAAVGIGAIQVPRGAHHPVDVVAGAMVGWAAEAVVNAAWQRLFPPRQGPRRRS
ncbi:phosphatase PAP2 family protein [Paracoccus suum]|uniref:Phosphatase PAP2 family protein n=1 Tax=Paracoccus suum TaxID=2259340 RepID=A0A344PJE8_9RHOB|nr:phosphatase PAP2 family protein [Paracoccus suum]AXC49503.1 phosphatase PAP2 family protein [Paracoccus suum]